MPRLPRLELPGVPLHVTQRGINKGAIFLDADDRYHFRHLLRRAFREHGIPLHAFVLMDNHFHLLLTPGTTGAMSRAMGWVGQSYVQAFNLRHARCGALWQGRFKSCLVQSERYLLTVMRYIELNPVRAAMVETPEDFRWSSVHTHLARARDPLITPHPLYLALGNDPAARAHAHQRWLDAGIAPDDLQHLRAYARGANHAGTPCHLPPAWTAEAGRRAGLGLISHVPFIPLFAFYSSRHAATSSTFYHSHSRSMKT